MWPVYFKNQLLVGNPENPVGICTLWTLKERIAQYIEKQRFSVCGQLYSKQGVKYIIRNILANPRLYFLILCGQDKSQSGKYLLETIEKPNYSDQEVSEGDFEGFRQNVRIIDLREEMDVERIKKVIAGLEEKSGFWVEPKVFQTEETFQTETYPTDSSVFKLRYPTVAKAWPWILKHIMRFGTEKQTDYGGKQKELLNLAAVIYDEDPENMEWVDYFDFSRSDFERYVPQILSPEHIEGMEYTYGERLRNFQSIDQIKEGIIEKLQESIDSRRAVACTWEVVKDIKSKQPPCITLVQALAQNGILHLTVYIRSNDMFKAWPQNALALRRLQAMISKEIKTKLGSLTTISASAHIYEQDFEKAAEVVRKYTQETRCVWDPRGNFVLDLDRQRKEIVVSHYSPDGIKIGEYRGKTSQELAWQLDRDLAVSQVSHAFDLGTELYKAQLALETGREYHQDQ